MASDGTRGRRIAFAVERIEKACSVLSGGEKLGLPTRSRYDNEMLLIFQLERLAEFLEGLTGDTQMDTQDDDTDDVDVDATDYQSMSNNQLKRLIDERGLTKGAARSKPELIAVLEAADEESE